MSNLPTKSILLCILVLAISPAFSQQEILAPDGGGENQVETVQCITKEQRDKVEQRIEQNIQDYNIQLQRDKSMIVYFDWPLIVNPSSDYNQSWFITNFVDHNVNWPNQLEDYNCSNYTYDVVGYNHQGIDIALWPFDHNQVQDETTLIIAAADGTIMDKNDGEVDNNCNFNSMDANYVILEHSDGSESWYWHMKNGSVTSKSIGATVTAGEVIGVVASSGNSTGPHIHFECYGSAGQLIDPFAGPCNDMNSATYWNNQRDYWDPTINTVLLHSAAPSLNSCPNLDDTNIETNFDPGDVLYTAAYYQDQSQGLNANYKLINPNGNVWANWNHSSPNDWRSSYWYWSYNLPNNIMTGTWTFQVTFDGHVESRDFQIGADCPTSYTGSNALSGTISTNETYETDGVIESTQQINGTPTVKYDSGTAIDLKQGFHVTAGAIFEAYIDGCGGI